MFFICLLVLYLIYIIYFYLTVGVENFLTVVNWEIFAKGTLFLFPLYILGFWNIKDKLTKFDYQIIYVPILFWVLLICLTGGKSGTNVFVVEMPLVLILSGIYLVKFPLQELSSLSNIASWKVGLVLWGIIFILISIAHFFIPFLRE